MPFEKRAGTAERRAYDLFARAGIPTPAVLGYDGASGLLSLEDLRETHESDWARAGEMADMAADLHAAFWDDYDTFGEVGLPWRLDSTKNFERHCRAMEKGVRPYCKAHKMDDGVFRSALDYLRSKIPALIDKRLHAGKNITVLHGDLHPENILLPKPPGSSPREELSPRVTEEGSAEHHRGAVFVDLEAVRMGLGAEDLAMLLALHLAPERALALPLLERYHQKLCIAGYSFEMLLADYKIAIAEALFFPVKLWHDGIDDPHMMERAIKSWKGLA